MLIRFPTVKGLVYTIDLSKIADRANPRTVEAPISGQIQEPTVIEWGDGTSEVVSSGTFPEHTYAEGVGDVFTVVMRSATGHLPLLQYCGDLASSQVTNPTKAVTFAVTSIDHFAGWSGSNSQGGQNGLCYACKNLKYVDTRLPGLSRWTALRWSFRSAGLEQPLESFCLAFVDGSGSFGFENLFNRCENLRGTIPDGFLDGSSALTSANGMFFLCSSLTGGIPADLFEKCTQITSFNHVFGYCSGLTPPPYIFWKADGSLDNDKFPSLTTAVGAYGNCSEALRAQVPEDYGGTMTVS